MKTLAHQTLIYDVDCPLCKVYTSGFISAKLLDKNGRKPFCQLTEHELQFVDKTRAANQIALIDNQTQTAIYGIDSLLKILGNAFPWIEKIGKQKWIYLGLQKLYSFVSYNRKVIAPMDINQDLSKACLPDFNLKYRLMYLFLGSLFVSFSWQKAFVSTQLLQTNLGEVWAVFLGSLGLISLVLFQNSTQRIFEILGNWMTILVMGSLVLQVFLGFQNPNAILGKIGFVFSALLMVWETLRRCKLLFPQLKKN
ncbi:MAG: hypothetical protein C4K58_04500 [Flavobacteriaceae bacterium]|nr:MAG: hypothetical protein C4K58_04500 [Flavobacteriaceae bacterium]